MVGYSLAHFYIPCSNCQLSKNTMKMADNQTLKKKSKKEIEATVSVKFVEAYGFLPSFPCILPKDLGIKCHL